MRNLWLVARHEYTRLATRRSFLLSTLGFPLLLAVIFGIVFLLESRSEQVSIGYVDLAGIIDPAVVPAEASETEIVPFVDEAAARAALTAGDIEGYYLIPQDYQERRQTRFYFAEERPDDSAQRAFVRLLRANLVNDLPEPVQQRLIEGIGVTVRSADGNRSIGANNIMGFLLPFISAMLFIIAVMTSAGYLLQVVAEEKENRTMEILVTTIRPLELIAGKALGLMALALTQLTIWGAAVVVTLVVGSRFWTFLQGIEIPWAFFGLAALFFLPSYALIAGMMTAIGAAVTEVRQGQQVAGMLNLLFVAPLFVLPVLMGTPNSPLAVGLTLFPTSAFVTVTLRWAIGGIPNWQLIASWTLLVLSAGLSLWISARIFRAGMLRYGQPLSFRAVLATIQGR